MPIQDQCCGRGQRPAPLDLDQGAAQQAHEEVDLGRIEEEAEPLLGQRAARPAQRATEAVLGVVVDLADHERDPGELLCPAEPSRVVADPTQHACGQVGECRERHLVEVLGAAQRGAGGTIVRYGGVPVADSAPQPLGQRAFHLGRDHAAVSPPSVLACGRGARRNR